MRQASVRNASLGQAATYVPFDVAAIECTHPAGGNIFFSNGNHVAQFIQATLPSLQCLDRFAQNILLAFKASAGKLGRDALL